MKVVCPSCDKIYQIPSERIKRKACKATCKQCGSKFIIRQRDDPEALEPAVAFVERVREDPQDAFPQDEFVQHEDRTVISNIPELKDYDALPVLGSAAFPGREVSVGVPFKGPPVGASENGPVEDRVKPTREVRLERPAEPRNVTPRVLRDQAATQLPVADPSGQPLRVGLETASEPAETGLGSRNAGWGIFPGANGSYANFGPVRGDGPPTVPVRVPRPRVCPPQVFQPDDKYCQPELTPGQQAFRRSLGAVVFVFFVMFLVHGF